MWVSHTHGADFLLFDVSKKLYPARRCERKGDCVSSSFSKTLGDMAGAFLASNIYVDGDSLRSIRVMKATVPLTVARLAAQLTAEAYTVTTISPVC